MITAPPVLRCEMLSFRYRRWGQPVDALRKLNLSVESGEWVMLVGANGSGKSTLLRLAAGHLPVQEGRVEVAGRDVSRLSRAALAEHLYFVQQNPLLGTAPTLTVFENLAVATPSGGSLWVGQRRKEEFERLLGPYDLRRKLMVPAEALSAGQRQVLAVLLASLRPVSLVLLDEPTAALDTRNGKACLQAIDRLHKKGKTIVQVTHDREIVRRFGTRMVELKEGRVALNGGARSGRT